MIGEKFKPESPFITCERVLLFAVVQLSLRKLATVLLGNWMLLFALDCASLFAVCFVASSQAHKRGRSRLATALGIWCACGTLPWLLGALTGLELFDSGAWDFGTAPHRVRLAWLALFSSAMIKLACASIASVDVRKPRKFQSD